MAKEIVTGDSVVSIHYTLRGEDKEVIDSSDGGEPLVYLHGRSQIIPGLERELDGKKVGDALKVEVAPAEGYGEYDESLKISVERGQFPKGAEIKEGSMFELANDAGGSLVVRVIGVTDESVEVDGNHPLAGQKLFFEVKLVDIRKATADEIEHGHAHGPGGHHHD